jgi:hypothetical protein
VERKESGKKREWKEKRAERKESAERSALDVCRAVTLLFFGL